MPPDMSFIEHMHLSPQKRRHQRLKMDTLQPVMVGGHLQIEPPFAMFILIEYSENT